MTAFEKEMLAESAAGEEPPEPGPVDLAHLHHYTAGDKALAREVLSVFCQQADSYCAQLRSAETQEDWKRAAHTLKGSARGIGAWAVASAAQAAERLPFDCEHSNRESAMTLVEAAVVDARNFILKLP